MPTFFDEMKCSYAQVKLEGDSADQIDVDTFLQATESMIKLFGLCPDAYALFMS